MPRLSMDTMALDIPLSEALALTTSLSIVDALALPCSDLPGAFASEIASLVSELSITVLSYFLPSLYVCACGCISLSEVNCWAAVKTTCLQMCQANKCGDNILVPSRVQ